MYFQLYSLKYIPVAFISIVLWGWFFCQITRTAPPTEGIRNAEKYFKSLKAKAYFLKHDPFSQWMTLKKVIRPCTSEGKYWMIRHNGAKMRNKFNYHYFRELIQVKNAVQGLMHNFFLSHVTVFDQLVAFKK